MPNKKYLYLILEFFIFMALMVFYATHSMLLPDPSKPYSTEIFHRLQTNAFLQGKIILSSQPFGYIQDFNWSDRGMSQNWGLGIPLLELPFEWIAKQCGFAPFPDKLTLLFYLTLIIILLNVSLRSLLLTFGVTAHSFMGFLLRWYSIIWILFCPAINGLIQWSFFVFEKTIFYACMYALMLLSLFWIYLRKPHDRIFLVLCLASGFACLIRPTLIFYGLTTAILTMIYSYQYKRDLRLIVIGTFLLCLGIGVDLSLNYYRFGSMLEFGYSVSLSSDPRLDYALRFDYPFHTEPFLSAAKELVGSLFLNDVWRSGTYRFREWSFSTFNLSHLVVLIFGGGLFIYLSLIGFLRRKSKFWDLDNPCCKTILFSLSWGIICFGFLFVFYMYFPSLCSRYFSDFSVAISVIVISIILLVIYWAFSYHHWMLNKKFLILFLISLGIFFYCSNNSFFKFDYQAFKKKGYGMFVTSKEGVRGLVASFDNETLVNGYIPETFHCGQRGSLAGLNLQFSGWDISNSCSVVGATSIFLPTKRCLTINYSFLNLNPQPLIRVKRNIEFLKLVSSQVVKNDLGNSHQEQMTQVFCADKPPLNPIALYSLGWGTPRQLGGQLSVILNWVSVADKKNLPSNTKNKDLRDNTLWHRWDFLPTNRPVLINITANNVLDFHEGYVFFEKDMAKFGSYWKNNDQIFFNPNKQGSEIGFLLRFTKALKKNMSIALTTAPDAGIIDILLNNMPLTQTPIDLYSQNIYIKKVDLSGVAFQKGNNILTIKVIGHNALSRSMCLGVDTIGIGDKNVQ